MSANSYYAQGGGQGPPHQQAYSQQGYQPGPYQGYQQHSQPPNQGYGNLYQPQNQPYPPPVQAQYGGYGSQQSQHNAPPSPGYIPGQQPQADMSRAADELRSAMKGFGTDEKVLIRVLSQMGPLEINGTKAAFQARHHRDLIQDVHSETSGHFRDGLMALLRGPLDEDCHILHDALDRIGTKEIALNDVLLARTNADINAIKAHYQHKYHRSLETDLKADLSMKTERLFEMVLSARRQDESSPVIPQQIDADVDEIYRGTEGRAGTDQIGVCSIITSRSTFQVRAIAQTYKDKYRRSLDDNIRKEFSGHMEQALLFIIQAAEDPAKHDADVLEEAMRGVGTNDAKLIRRVVAIHWNPERMDQCKRAYQHFYHRSLAERIRGETKGEYERLLLACIGGL